MAAHYFIRALAELFPGSAAVPRKSQAAPVSTVHAEPAPAQPRRVGEGAPNETFVSIEDVPNLFVDEGDCIVQFIPAFEEGARDTPFGTKILPELAPHWSVVREHASPLKDAISTAIRSRSTPPVALATASVEPAFPQATGHSDPVRREPGEPDVPKAPRTPRESTAHRGDMLAATHGKVVSWGEEKFPNRKRTGKPFYTSFALHIHTALGEQVLQGEGLKDAIAESHCKVGDVVSVRRLRKVKVPAFTDSGRPIMKDGEQVLWDKWLWSIAR